MAAARKSCLEECHTPHTSTKENCAGLRCGTCKEGRRKSSMSSVASAKQQRREGGDSRKPKG